MDGAAAFDYAVFAGAPAATVKVICPDTLHCLALVPSEDRLSFAAANPWDTYQIWEYIFQPDGSFVLVNREASWIMTNRHISVVSILYMYKYNLF